MKITTDGNTTAGATNRNPETTGERIAASQQQREELTAKGKQWSKPSPDGRWRSSLKHAGLMQFIPAGTYYARCKVGRKSIRASLETDVFTTAKLRLPDKLKELRTPKAEVGTFMDGRLRYEAETQNDYTLAPLSKTYRLRCVECLLKTWPGVDKLKVDSIEEADCKAWAARYAAHYSPTVFNNTVNTLRRILALAGLGHDANPAMKLERLGQRHKQLDLPTSVQFERLVALIETSGAAQARDCGDFVRFLSFTGCRVAEAKQATWADVDWGLNELTIHCVKRRLTSSAPLTRTLPLNPALKQLLERLRVERNPRPGDHICSVFEAQGSLTRACRLVGCQRLTHHSLRHLFTTRCVEAGIDFATVGRWLGHSDGGMLVSRTYGHLRREHSQKQAALVTFGVAPIPANVLPLPAAAVATA
jgi:integrase